jgi:hypothetical protein
MKIVVHQNRASPVSVRGVMKAYAEKSTTAADPKISREAFDPKKLEALYPSDSYQKVLDYHVVEILLSTIVVALIVLLRLHH